MVRTGAIASILFSLLNPFEIVNGFLEGSNNGMRFSMVAQVSAQTSKPRKSLEVMVGGNSYSIEKTSSDNFEVHDGLGFVRDEDITHKVIFSKLVHDEYMPLLANLKGEVQPLALTASGMPLGVVPDQIYGETAFKLEVGDTIVIYTDGVSEAMNPDNEIYGRERLTAYLGGEPKELEELVQGVIGDVERFCDGRPQRDDVCLVCLRRTE